MGVRKDLKRARKRTDLASRTRVDLLRDDTGTVREARTAPLVAPPTTGSTADLPFTNAAEAPEAVVLRRRRPPAGTRSPPPRSPPRSPRRPRA